MADIEEVITGLELCTNISQDGCMMLCPYKDEQDETYSGFCEHILKQDALELLNEQKELLEKKQHDLDQMCYENSRLRHLLNDRQPSNAVLWKDGEKVDKLSNDISTWTATQKKAKIKELKKRKEDCYEEIRKISVVIARLMDSLKDGEQE